MNGALLNVWREIGAYLRYADAKCIFLSGISFGLLFSFIRFKLVADNVGWDMFSHLSIAKIDVMSWMTILMFGGAFLLCSAAAIPSLTDRPKIVSVLITLGNYFSRNTETLNTIYFRDIAAFSNDIAYQEEFLRTTCLKKPLNKAEKALCRQIWIISRIAMAKFFATNLSLFLLFIGLVVAFL